MEEASADLSPFEPETLLLLLTPSPPPPKYYPATLFQSLYCLMPYQSRASTHSARCGSVGIVQVTLSCLLAACVQNILLFCILQNKALAVIGKMVYLFGQIHGLNGKSNVNVRLAIQGQNCLY